VHASKGLEFDEVVVVGLDRKWGSGRGAWGVLAIDPTAPPRMVAPLFSEPVRQWVPELALVERDECRRRLLDDLSALYVSITRAKHGVHLVMDRVQSASGPTGARLIMAAVDGASTAEDRLAGCSGFASALAGAEPSSERPFWTAEFGVVGEEHPPGPTVPAAVPAGAVDDGPAPLVEIVARASGSAAPPSQHAGALWQFDPFADDDTALRGVLVHECFREVRTAADLGSDASRRAIVAAARRRAAVEKATPIGDALADEVLATLARCAAGRVGAALDVDPSAIVRTELPFVRETRSGLVHGRIDRLELLRGGGADAGRVSRARIVDFKTGAADASAANLAAKCAGYFEQLEGYCAAVGEMYGLGPESIECVLLFVDRDEVVMRPSGVR